MTIMTYALIWIKHDVAATHVPLRNHFCYTADGSWPSRRSARHHVNTLQKFTPSTNSSVDSITWIRNTRMLGRKRSKLDVAADPITWPYHVRLKLNCSAVSTGNTDTPFNTDTELVPHALATYPQKKKVRRLLVPTAHVAVDT